MQTVIPGSNRPSGITSQLSVPNDLEIHWVLSKTTFLPIVPLALAGPIDGATGEFRARLTEEFPKPVERMFMHA